MTPLPESERGWIQTIQQLPGWRRRCIMLVDMMRPGRASVLFSLLTLVGACGVGGDDTQMPGGGSGTPIPGIDEGMLCSATFKITGTFAPGTAPRPIDPESGLPSTACWPVGTWTFTAQMDSNQCSSAPTVLSSYSFRVDRTPADDGGDDTVQTLVNLTNVGALKSHLAVSINGQGCEGKFEVGTADGKEYWAMQPTLGKDPVVTTLAGTGDYYKFSVDAWPWK